MKRLLLLATLPFVACALTLVVPRAAAEQPMPPAPAGPATADMGGGPGGPPDDGQRPPPPDNRAPDNRDSGGPRDHDHGGPHDGFGGDERGPGGRGPGGFGGPGGGFAGPGGPGGMNMRPPTLDTMRGYMELVTRYGELSKDPSLAGVSAVLTANDMLRAKGPDAGIAYFTKLLPDVKDATVQRAIRLQLIELYKRAGKTDEALAQLETLIKGG